MLIGGTPLAKQFGNIPSNSYNWPGITRILEQLLVLSVRSLEACL